MYEMTCYILYSEIDKALSLYREDSELIKINENAWEKPVKCSEIVWENLLLAKKMYEMTDGYFDVTSSL